MIFKTLKLINFRQFYGETPEIEFSTDPKKPLTVFLAENGSGKTTILNAFKWLLYDVTSNDFDLKKTGFVNTTAIKEAPVGNTVEASVKLTFTDRNRIYRLERSIKAIKQSDTEAVTTQDELTLVETNYKGESKRIDRVKEFINVILPKELHTFFFFNGERIERIVDNDADEQAKLARATKKIMGTGSVQLAAEYLEGSMQTFRKEMNQDHEGTLTALIETQEQLESDRETAQRNIERYNEDLEIIQEEWNNIESRIIVNSNGATLIQRRNELKRSIEETETRLNLANEELNESIASSGYKLLLEDMINEFEEIAENLRKKGELPKGIKESFIDDLLINGTCICGISLSNNKEAINYLNEFKKTAGSDDIETQANQLGFFARDVKEEIPNLWTKIRQKLNEIDSIKAALSTMTKDLIGIKNELEDLGTTDENIESLLKNKNDLNLHENDVKAKLTLEKDKLDNDEHGIIKKIRDIEGAIETAKVESVEAELAQKRYNSAKKSRDFFNKIIEYMDSNIREQLSQKINAHWAKASSNVYNAQLDSNYNLTLYDPISSKGIMGSTGERQMLSLSFVSGLIELTKELRKKKSDDDIMSEDAEYPFVIDAAWTSLDVDHVDGVVKMIPTVADQALLMCHSEQWMTQVRAESEQYIGKAYAFIDHTSKEGKGSPIIFGKKVSLRVRSDKNHRYTKIEEIK